MGPGRRPQQADRGRPVVAGGGAAVGAGQIEHPVEGHRLQGQRQQGRGAAEAIEIHQLEALLALQALRQQVLGRAGAAAQTRQASEIALQQGQPIGIGVVGPHRLGTGLQAVAQGADATASHGIEHP